MAYSTGSPIPARFLLVKSDGQTALENQTPTIKVCPPGLKTWHTLTGAVELGNGFYEIDIPAMFTQAPGRLIVTAQAPDSLPWRDLIDIRAAGAQPEPEPEPEPEPDNILFGDWQTPGNGTQNHLASTGPDAFAYSAIEQNRNQQAYMRGIEITAGQAYALLLEHSSDQPATGRIYLHDHTETGRNLGIDGQEMVIGASMQEQLIRFVAPAGSSNGRLRFMFSAEPGNVIRMQRVALVRE